MNELLITKTLPALLDALSTTAEASRRIHEALERCQGSDSRANLYFLGRATERLNADRETLYAAGKLFMEASKLDLDRILARGGESHE
jgi:hypothetical protein